MNYTCRYCSHPIEYRTSAKSGRRYAVNATGTPGTAGQLHSYHCTHRRSAPTPAIPDSPNVSPAPTSPASPPTSDLAKLIADTVAPLLANVNEARVREIVEELTRDNLRVVVSVKGSEDIPDVDCGQQHKQFPLILKLMARHRNVWMSGPAGSGKTRAAHEAAKALGLNFGAISVGPQTTQSALFGFIDAHGNYIPTEFRRRYENGGVFLFDEIDRGNPGVLTALNQAIENGTCAFPDGMIGKHTDFIAIAAANTFGNGASREYVGALQLDAATLDRFVMLAWEYDEKLERDLATATFAASGGTNFTILEAWIVKVRNARAKASELKVRHVISPRASIVGADLLAVGIPESTVAACVLWKGLDSDTIERLS